MSMTSILARARVEAGRALAAAKAQRTENAVAMSAKCALVQERDPTLLSVLSQMVDALENDDAAVAMAEKRLAQIEEWGAAVELRRVAEERRAEAERQAAFIRDAERRLLDAQSIAGSSEHEAAEAMAELDLGTTHAELEALYADLRLGPLPTDLVSILTAPKPPVPLGGRRRDGLERNGAAPPRTTWPACRPARGPHPCCRLLAFSLV